MCDGLGAHRMPAPAPPHAVSRERGASHYLCSLIPCHVPMSIKSLDAGEPEPEDVVSAARAGARRGILDELAQHRGECRVLALAPELARFLYGHDPEPGSLFVGVPMVVDPSLGRYGWRLREASASADEDKQG